MTHTRLIRNNKQGDSESQQPQTANSMSTPLRYTHLAGDRIQWQVGELELIFGEIEYAFQGTPNDTYEAITLNWVLERMQSSDGSMVKEVTQILRTNGYHNRSEAHVIELIEALIDNFGGGLKGYEKALSRVFEKEPISYVSDIITATQNLDAHIATPPFEG